MRDGDHRLSRLHKDPPQFRQQAFPQPGVQRPQRLVQHQQRRARRQTARQRHPLLFAARQRVDVAPPHAFQADQRKGFFGPFLNMGLPPHAQAEGHVLRDSHVREQGIVLKHQAEIAPVHRHVAEVFALEQDRATVWRLQTRDDPQQRGLAAAAGPQQTDDFAGPYRKGDVVEHLFVAEALAYLTQLQHQNAPLPARWTRSITTNPRLQVSSRITLMAIAWPMFIVPGWPSKR